MMTKIKKVVLLTKNVIKNPGGAVTKVTRKLSNEGLTGFTYAVKKKLSSSENTPENNIVDMNAEYLLWREDNKLSENDLQEQRDASEKFKKKPVISIITPVYKPPVDVLEELILSVLAQTYPYFELCFAEVAQNAESIALIKKYQKIDSRIKARFMPTNGGIAIDSNACLEQATGDYIALLDHDDLISPDALYENAKMLNEDDYDFLYSDKDKIDEGGKHYEPLFKPGWSPEIMFNANYLTHLNVFKHSLIKKIGGWRTDTDGAQDWDLFLRLIKASKKVGHIPKVLYHWRVLETSTAHSIMAKPYAMDGQKNAIMLSAKEAGLDVKVTHTKDGFLGLSWEDQKVNKKIAIIYITELDDKNAKSKLSKQLKFENFNYTVVPISAQDGKGFLTAIQEGLKDERNILVLSDSIDSKITDRQMQELSGWLSINDVAVVSPHIKSHDGGFFDIGRILGFRALFGPIYTEGTYTPAIFGFHEWVRNTSAGSPYFSLLKPSSLAKITKDLKYNNGESMLDIFWKINLLLRGQDFRVVSNPYVTLNVEKGTPGQEARPSDHVVKLAENMFGPTTGDNYFNKNLSLKLRGPQFEEHDITDELRNEIFINNLRKGADLDAVSPNANGGNSNQSQYQNEASALSTQYDFSVSDIDASIKATKSKKKIDNIDTAIWFIPMFEGLYAGLKNIYSLANELTRLEGTSHIFVLNTNGSVNIPKKLVLSQFPALKNSKFISINKFGNPDTQAASTIAVCTLWTTAYDMLKYNNTDRKCYILQDWEPDFYPKGTLSAMSEATYDFGYLALAGTEALGERYVEYSKGNQSAYLPSLLDLSDYLDRTKLVLQDSKPKTDNNLRRVMFYGRPDAPRNAFELGVAALSKLKLKLGDAVEIVIAGAQSYSKEYELEAKGLVVAGKVPYSELAEFYASFDVCLSLMYSQHPGVIPLEMMASGVPVVINQNKSTDWLDLYKHNHNCIISKNSPTEITNSIVKVLNDDALRDELIANGLKLAEEYSGTRYQDALIKVIEKIKN